MIIHFLSLLENMSILSQLCQGFFFESAMINGVLKRCVLNKLQNSTYDTIISFFFLTIRLKYERFLELLVFLMTSQKQPKFAGHTVFYSQSLTYNKKSAQQVRGLTTKPLTSSLLVVKMPMPQNDRSNKRQPNQVIMNTDIDLCFLYTKQAWI